MNSFIVCANLETREKVKGIYIAKINEIHTRIKELEDLIAAVCKDGVHCYPPSHDILQLSRHLRSEVIVKYYTQFALP